MGDKQSGHNNISPTKLNSIHHKVVINTDKVERIDSTDYNMSCNCGMRLDGGGDGADDGMMLMMISMMPVTMVMMMAMISPSGRRSPRWNLPARDGFSSL